MMSWKAENERVNFDQELALKESVRGVNTYIPNITQLQCPS